jgi:TRAP-type C4-dicarboxylate transport system permease small subunit
VSKNRLHHNLANFCFQWLPTVMRAVLLVASIFLTILIFGQVWLRYIFHLPLLWVEELAVIPAFWLYMMGAAYGAYERSHIKADIVNIAIKSQRRQVLIRFIASLIGLGLGVLFTKWGASLFTWDLRFNPRTYTLLLPFLWGHSSMFIAGGIMVSFYLFLESVDLARQLFAGKAPLFQKKE